MQFLTRTIIAALFLVGIAAAQPAGSSPLLDELLGPGPVQQRSEAEWEKAFGQLLDSLMPGMSADAIPDREQPQLTLERICHRAGQPGADAERAGLCRAMLARLKSDTPKDARVWLLRKIEPLGREESAEPLALLLSDPDVDIRELARRALINNPTEAALNFLRQRLAGPAGEQPPTLIALIQALAARKDVGSIPSFIKLSKSPDDGVALASIRALGNFATNEALDALGMTARQAEGVRGEVATLAAIRCAENFIAAGKPDTVEPLLVQISQQKLGPAVHRAVRGALVRARGAQGLSLLLELLNSDDRDDRRAAADLARQTTFDALIKPLCDDIAKLPPESQALLLNALAARGAAQVRPFAVASLQSTNADVAAAAVRALRDVGDAACVLPLAELAAKSSTQRLGVRDTLARMRGATIDEEIVRLIPTAPAAARAELIRSTAARHHKAAVPLLLQQAGEGEIDVRVAALDALANLADARDAARVLPLALSAADETLAKSAEDAVVTISLRNADKNARAMPLIDQLHHTTPTGMLALLRMLGRLEGPQALQVLQVGRENGDAAIADASIRALAGWSSVEVLDDLADVVLKSTDEAQRMIALRGYVRLVRLPSSRTPAETLALLKRVTPATESVDSRKLMLSALAEVPTAAALSLITDWLGNKALSEEGTLAALSVVRGIAAADGDSARATLAQLSKLEVSGETHKKVEEAAAWLDKMNGYCAAWLVSPVYEEKGRDRAALFDSELAPERGEKVEWKPLAITDAANPWMFDFTHIDGGQNRCIYVKTAVWSENDQPARVELGSDDGGKVWLNGQMVFSKNVVRPVQQAEDRFDVSLKAGWNTLLLKIPQGAGGWGFILGLKRPDGGNLTGLKFEAKSE